MEHVLARDSTPIAYRTGGRGERVLFVHGTLASSADWVFVARLLRDRYTVVTMDRRGRGGSGFGTNPYSIQQEAGDIAAVAAATEARNVVAHSYGGLCTMVALDQGLDADAIVLYEPPASVPRGTFHEDTELAAHLRAGHSDMAAESFLAAADATEAELATIRQSPAWPAIVEAVPTLGRELAEVQQWATPEGPFDVLALLLVGGETTSPGYLDGIGRISAAFPRLRQQQIPGHRHLGHVLAPKAFADAVAAFLG